MENFIRVLCTHIGWSFDEMIQQYNLNKKTKLLCINYIINYKIENNTNIIYKEDIPKIVSKIYKQNISQEKFMEEVMIQIKNYNLDINNLTIENSIYIAHLWFYYMSTFLEHKPVDIKIALKD